MAKINKPLTDAEVNHLRRLLGWVRCEVGQAPEEMVETLKAIAPAVGQVTDPAAEARMRAAYEKSAAVPKYVRAAIKALEKTIVQRAGEIVDAEPASEVPEVGHSPEN